MPTSPAARRSSCPATRRASSGYRTGSVTARYSYDGDGLLASRTVNGVATSYTWDLSQASPELLAAGPTSYIYGPDGQPVEQVTGSAATFLMADQQGNTRLLTSASGTVAGTYSYGPYGTATYSCPSQQASQCATTAIQYRGQYTDSASRDLYLGSRYYNPATGQYLTPAPATANALAPYTFADDDPVNSEATSLTWNPVAPGPSLWDELGGIAMGLVDVADAVASDSEDEEPGPGASSGSADGEDEGLAADEAEEDDVEADEAINAGPVTGYNGLVDTQPEAEDTGWEAASPSCWALPGSGVSCRAFLVNQLKQVDINGLVSFINDSIDAAQTCSNPQKSSLPESAAGVRSGGGPVSLCPPSQAARCTRCDPDRTGGSVPDPAVPAASDYDRRRRGTVSQQLDQVSRAFNRSSKAGVGVTANALTIGTTAYEDFTKFRSVVSRCIAALDRHVSPAAIERVGLRYVNEVRVPAEIRDVRDWDSWISNALVGASATIPDHKAVSLQGMLQYEIGADRSLVLRFAAAPEGAVIGNEPLIRRHPSPEGPFFALDLDSFWQPPADAPADWNTDEIMTVLDELHAPVGSAFQAAITGKLRDTVLRRTHDS